MLVTRDFTAAVEDDGEDFAIVLWWSESTRFGYRHRKEHTFFVEAADLPRELVQDRTAEYMDRFGDDAEDDAGALTKPSER